jgi:hypothetical protein
MLCQGSSGGHFSINNALDKVRQQYNWLHARSKVENNLRKVVEMHQIDWNERLPFFLLPYRASVHETTMHNTHQHGVLKVVCPVTCSLPLHPSQQGATYN